VCKPPSGRHDHVTLFGFTVTIRVLVAEDDDGLKSLLKRGLQESEVARGGGHMLVMPAAWPPLATVIIAAMASRLRSAKPR